MYEIYHENSHELVGSTNIRNYILGGRGIVTLVSPTGVHHTYVFKRPKNPGAFSKDVMFVYVATANKQWKYVGMYSRHAFKYTASSRFNTGSAIFLGAKYIVKMMEYPELKTPMKLYHEGCCSVCGRRLTDPSSLEFGIGRRCREKSIKNGYFITV